VDVVVCLLYFFFMRVVLSKNTYTHTQFSFVFARRDGYTNAVIFFTDSSF